MMKWQDLPPYLFYPLLIPHVLGLCVKYRTSVALISASNPCFPYGGLPFASKAKMQDVFEGDLGLKHILLNHEDALSERQAAADAFIEQTGFPIIVKPETGHRGLDVKKADNTEQLKTLIDGQKWNVLLQEFSPSPQEFGVFYYRYPDQDKGDIFSITHKIIPNVIGDGKRSVAELIKAGHFPKEEHYFATLKPYELEYVPKEGESRNLMVTAAHCYGTDFQDGSRYKTQTLVDKMNELCIPRDFYFGRFDLKADSVEALQRGEFHIIEINGATSEFGHAYDDKFTFKEGFNLFRKQWSMLFEVSHKNRDKVKPMSFSEFMRRYVSFFIKSKQATGKLW